MRKSKDVKASKPFYKKWWFYLIVIIIVLGMFDGGGKSDKKTEVKVPESSPVETESTESVEKTVAEEPVEEESIPTPFDVVINATGHKEDNGVIFDIDTNLPDETEFILTLSKGDSNTDDYSIAQAKVAISDGKAASDPFSNKGEPLTGDYDLVISMSRPKLQSAAVQAVIGENGEYITGPLVDASSGTVRAFFSVTTDADITVTPSDEYTHTIFREESDEIEEDVEPEEPTCEEETESSQWYGVDQEYIDNHKIEIIAAAIMALNNYTTEYELSLAEVNWDIEPFGDKDTILAITDITLNNQKGQYYYVGTLDIDGTGKVIAVTPHHIEAVDTISGDDGYCDAFLETAQTIIDSYSD